MLQWEGMAKRRLVVGNWKMNPRSLKEAKRLFGGIARRARSIRGAQIVVCPPVPYVYELIRGYTGTKVRFGVQNISVFEKEGAHTGETSGQMLRSLGIEYVIVGHSERRALGESDEEIGRKVVGACKSGLVPIVCIGENERDAQGRYLAVLENQIRDSLASVSRTQAQRLIIAYEPLWAIGKGANDAITPHELHGMSIFIKKILTKLYGRKTGMAIRILYGGSVEEANIDELQKEESIDGFLVGHASLDPQEFIYIAHAA